MANVTFLDRLMEEEDFEYSEPGRFWIRFTALLCIAVVIASLGLFRDASAVVIAAMLIAPLMTPILGIATAIVRGRSVRMLYLIFSVLLASVGTIGLAYVIMELFDAPLALEIPAQVLARTDPGLEELLVALASGIAGAYVQMRASESALLPGVAIGVSLVPPLCAGGILLYFGDFGRAYEAILLFTTNLAAIVLSASAVFIAMGMRPEFKERERLAGFGLGTILTIAGVVFLTIELGRVSLQRFDEAREEREIASTIAKWAQGNELEILRLDVSRNTDPKTVELWLVVDVPAALDELLLAPKQLIPKALDGEALRTGIIEVVGPKTILQFRMNIRYSEDVELWETPGDQE